MRQLKISKRITERSDEAIEAYLTSVSKQDPITAEEEAELARRIHEGDREALDKLVSANLRFVISVAKQYQNQGLALADLISEGNLGLVRAAEKFDETRGFKFISYAVWWIRQSIMKAINENGRLVRLPSNQNNFYIQIRKIQDKFEQEENRPASTGEIAEALDCEESKVKETLRSVIKGVSLDAPLSDEDGGTLVDITANDDIETDNNAEQESLSKDLEEIMNSSLKERDIFVLKHFFGIGCAECSQEEIGEMLGLTRERVRQIRERALGKIRNCQTGMHTLMAYC